jgi:hypothetical protein
VLAYATKAHTDVDNETGSTWLLKANLESTGLCEVRVENQPEDAAASPWTKNPGWPGAIPWSQ